MKPSSLICCSLAILATVSAAPSLGATPPGDGLEKFTFRIDREALTRSEGVIKVYGALARAAQRACSDIGSGQELWRRNLRRACEASLVDQVVAAAAAPTLAAHHQGSWHNEVARTLERDPSPQDVQHAAARRP